VDNEYAAFEALSKADRLSLLREKIAPGLDLSSLTDAAIIHLLFMGGKYPTAKGQPDLPSKKEIKKRERAALKENRALQRELKAQVDDLLKQMPKNERTPTGRAISRQIDAITPWLKALEAEVKTLKNPPTPAGAAKSSANFEQTLGLMTAALADPSMRLPDLNKLWKRLLGLQQKTETALEIQGVLAGEGVAQRYRRRQDKATAKTTVRDQKREEEVAQVAERKKERKVRPPRPPITNSPPHPIFKTLPRNYRGLPNVTRQRLMALAQDIQDDMGFLESSDGDRLKEIAQNARGRVNQFWSTESGMTKEEASDYRKLLRKAQPKRWLKGLADAIEKANLAVKVYEGIRKPTRWDDQMFYELSSQLVQLELMDMAYNQPALTIALGADLGFKWKPKSVARGGGSQPKGYKGRGHYSRPKSREKDDPWAKNNLSRARRASTGDPAMSDRKALIRLASTLPTGSEDRRTILSALKPQMSGAGGWLVYNDKTKKQVAHGFSDLHAAKRWIEDRERFNKETHHLLQQKIDKAIKGFEKWVAKLYLNDLGRAYNQMGDLEGVFNQLGHDIRDEYGDYVSRSDYIEFYEELTDDGFYGMEEAIEEVEHDLNEMIGNGWADDGYEDQVQEEIENQILPRFEDALDTFRSEYGKVPRVAKTASVLACKKTAVQRRTLSANARFKRWLKTIDDHMQDRGMGYEDAVPSRDGDEAIEKVWEALFKRGASPMDAIEKVFG